MTVIQRICLVALMLSSTAGAFGNAFVGTTSSFFNSPICRSMHCTYLDVQSGKLEGSGNAIRIYRYAIRSGSQIAITRFHLPGQQGHQLMVTARYVPRSSRWTSAGVQEASQFASAASGFTIRAAQINACFEGLKRQGGTHSQFVQGGFEDAGVWCFRKGTVQGIEITLTQ